MKQDASHWFARGVAAILILFNVQSPLAADTIDGRKLVLSRSSDEIKDFLNQLQSRFTNSVVYDKNGSVVSVDLYAFLGTPGEGKLELASRLSTVKQLWVLGSQLTDGGCAALPRMTNLVKLVECGRSASKDSVSAISQLNQLQYLSLNMYLAPADLPYLSRMTNLTNLSLSAVPMLGNNALPALTNLVRLRRLRLSGTGETRQVNVFTQVDCLTNLPNLEDLSIIGLNNFRDQELRELKHAPNLKHLEIFQDREGRLWPTDISDNWPEIVQTFPALTNAKVTLDGKTRTWSRDH